MKKALIVASVFGFLDFEVNDIKLLQSLGYEIHTATNMMEADWLKNDGSLDYLGMVNHQIDFGRTPFNKQSVIAYKQIEKLLRQERFDLIHCHTPVAAAIVRVVANKARKSGTKVIYTAHGFHFHKKSALKDWMIYYPIERILSRLTDMIITINHEDYKVIQRFHTQYKCYIPGVGVDVNYISSLEFDRKNYLQEKYGIPTNSFVILSVGELSDRKNHKIVIKALGMLKRKELYYIIVGVGEKKQELLSLAREYGVEERIVFPGGLPHEEVLRLGHVVDLGAVPSKIEGLGLTGIEILAAGTPLIGSNVHGIKDYIIDGVTGVSCSPNNELEFAEAIKTMMDNREYYDRCKTNTVKIAENFDLCRVSKLMLDNYMSIINS